MGNKRLELSGQLISLLFEVCVCLSISFRDYSVEKVLLLMSHKDVYTFSCHFLFDNLLQDLFKTMISEVQKHADNVLSKRSRSSPLDFSMVSTFFPTVTTLFLATS